MKVQQSALEAIRTHGAEGYPNEICGILIGPPGGGVITETRRARNLVVERARDRYEIDPLDHIKVQREADAAGLEIVGYYHSHPDHPAQASRFDTERSWAGYVYVIVAVDDRKPMDVNAFVTENDGGPFHTEPLDVV